MRKLVFAVIVASIVLAGCSFTAGGYDVKVTPTTQARTVQLDDQGRPFCGEPGAAMDCLSTQIACDVMANRITEAVYRQRWDAGDVGGTGDCNVLACAALGCPRNPPDPIEGCMSGEAVDADGLCP